MDSTLFQYMYSRPLRLVHRSLQATVQVWHSRHLFRSKTAAICLPLNSDISHPPFLTGNLLYIDSGLVIDPVVGVVSGVDDVPSSTTGQLQRVQELAVQVVVVGPIFCHEVVPSMLVKDDIGRQPRPFLCPGKPLAHVVVDPHHVHVFYPSLSHDLWIEVQIDIPPLEPHEPPVIPVGRMDSPF